MNSPGSENGSLRRLGASLFRQLDNIRRNPPRLIFFHEQFISCRLCRTYAGRGQKQQAIGHVETG
jgi:hypothetical protein